MERNCGVHTWVIYERLNIRKNGYMQKKFDCNGKFSWNNLVECVELETTGFKILRLPETISATELKEMGI